MGWHLYIRDYRPSRRNKDGYWGWIRRPLEHQLISELEKIGIISQGGDGTCDYDFISEIAKRYPIKGRRCGCKHRGCLEIEVDNFGDVKITDPRIKNL